MYEHTMVQMHVRDAPRKSVHENIPHNLSRYMWDECTDTAA